MPTNEENFKAAVKETQRLARLARGTLPLDLPGKLGEITAACIERNDRTRDRLANRVQEFRDRFDALESRLALVESRLPPEPAPEPNP